MRKLITHTILPWLVTIAALYFAFRDIHPDTLIHQLRNCDPGWISLAVLATMCSYLIRAYRWQFFFFQKAMHYWDAAKVLILGFFMNNILPARAGELVRAHAGSRISKETRTSVLATIASERLVDGLTVSVFFVVFSMGLGDSNMSHGMLYVALAFAAVTLCVITVLVFRQKVFHIFERLNKRFDDGVSSYVLERIRIFINGLSPLFMPSRLPVIIMLSIVTWLVELSVYYFISRAFDSTMSIPLCVLFLVAVNFSSLIPAAPGGIGVIEAVASAVLVSVGIPREIALSMTLCQHAIQYLVVGIPGLVIMLTWKRYVDAARALTDETQ